MKKKSLYIVRVLKILLIISGIAFLTLCVLAFTKIPFRVYYNLGTSNSKITRSPVTIVLLSGSGIPSESGLIRAYYTAILAKTYPEAKIMISIPGSLTDSISTCMLTVKELTIRGITKDRLEFENTGRNTREQALKLAAGKTEEQLSQPLTIVSAPEHMKRAILAFRKVGFKTVSGLPTFGNSLDTDLSYNDIDLKGNNFVPSIGNNLQIRYQFWTQLKLEVLTAHEYFALAFYKLKGWI